MNEKQFDNGYTSAAYDMILDKKQEEQVTNKLYQIKH